jgi:hypothetical protein
MFETSLHADPEASVVANGERCGASSSMFLNIVLLVKHPSLHYHDYNYDYHYDYGFPIPNCRFVDLLCDQDYLCCLL